MTHKEFAQIVATAFLKGVEFSMQEPDMEKIKAVGLSQAVTDAAKDYAIRCLRLWQSKLEKDK